MLKFSLTPVDASFFDVAPFRWTYHIDVAASPDEVWAGLVAYRPLAWCKMLNGHYTSPAPYGRGSTRSVTAVGTVLLEEEFFRWSDAERNHSFHVLKTNLPILKSFAEDYHVTAITGGARLTWRFAIEPKRGFHGVMKLSRFANEYLFSTFVRDTQRRFGKIKSTD